MVLIGQVEDLSRKLPEIEELDRQCDQAGLDESEREYTVYSVEDLIFDLGLVKTALQKKTGFLENQVCFLSAALALHASHWMWCDQIDHSHLSLVDCSSSNDQLDTSTIG
jgi:hypothetical protein